jgi:hypothetical protein
MKKQLRNLIISLCVIVLLVVGVVVWTKVVSPKIASSSSSESSSSEQTIQVFKTDSAKITSLKIKNKNGELTLHQKDKTYSLDGIKTELLDTGNISGAFETAADIEATKLIEKSASDLSKYGLNKPLVTVDIVEGDKTTTIYIGNTTPTGDGNYLCIKDNNDVYKVDGTVYTTFNYGELDYINKAICGVDDTDLCGITEMEFSGSARAFPIKLTEDMSALPSSTANGNDITTSSNATPVYKMVEPYTYEVDAQKTTKIVQDLQDVSATGIISLDMSDTNLAKYGLKNPKYKFSATYNGKKMTLDFGTPFTEDDINCVPVVLEGTPVIFKIGESAVEFYNYGLKDLCSSLLFVQDIANIDTVTVTKGSESYNIKLTGTADNLSGTCGGTKLKEDNIRNWYASIVGITFEDEVAKPSTSSVYMKVYITYRNIKKDPTTMEFIPIDSRRSFWTIDGHGNFYVLNSTIDSMFSKTKDLAAGKDISRSN